MSPAPACLGQFATVGLALALLARERRAVVPVLAQDGSLLGLLDRGGLLELLDALRRGAPDGRTFHDVLATDVGPAIVTRPPRCPAGVGLEEACARLVAEGAPALVVERDGRLLGLLTLEDAARALATAAPPAEDLRVAPTPPCTEVEPPPRSVLEVEHGGGGHEPPPRPPRGAPRTRRRSRAP